MSTSKHFDKICIIALVAALLLSLLLMNSAALGIQRTPKSMGYEEKLFDTSRVHTLDIVMDDWAGFLSTAQKEEYTACSVVIDGEAFKNVGIRGKGNTSLSTVVSMDSERYSFKLEFDQYETANSYYGLDKLSLNNLIQDNTMMKDYLTYRMMNEFDVAAPLCSFVYITVNGEDWGLYLAVEAVEESFLQRNYGSNYGDLYKPDSMNMGGGRGNGKDFDFENFTDKEAFDFSAPMPDRNQVSDGNRQFRGGFGGMGSSDTKLQYVDDQAGSYSAIFDSAKTDVTAADQQRLITALKELNQGDPAAALAIDDVIRYFVVHNFVVNADSYTGSMIHNYYLYEEDGRLSMVPWDYNLAFGTFQGGSADSMVNDDIDSPLSVTGNDRPMIDWIFDSSEYTELYHRYFREFLDTVDPAAIIGEAAALIDPYVEKDPTKFCTYEAFQKGIDTLTVFCDLRTQSVTAQLDGNTAEIDASGIILSDMGTMGGGMGGGRGQFPSVPEGGQFPQMPTNEQMPQMPQMGDRGNGMKPGKQNNMEKPNSTPDQPAFPNSNLVAVEPFQNNFPWYLIPVTLLVLAVGLLLACKYKR